MSQIGNDKLLTISDVAERTGLCKTIASVLISETGKAIVMHRRKFILESDLLEYLQKLADERTNNAKKVM